MAFRRGLCVSGLSSGRGASRLPRRGEFAGEFLLAGNILVRRTVVRHVNWVFVLLVSWLVLSVAVAVVFGLVVRARDERELPPPLDEDGEDDIRDVG